MSNLDFHTQNYISNGVSINKSLAEIERVKRRDNFFFFAISSIALLLIYVIFVLNTYVFFVAQVSGVSMVPTLQNGDKLITNRYKQPKVDDIITLRHQNSNGEYEIWIKRVIAVGGDRVQIKEGFVYVNGVKKNEPYIDNQPITFIKDGLGNASPYETYDYTLKDDEIFYLGDNRKLSFDARANGPCKVYDVVGVVENWSLWLNEIF